MKSLLTCITLALCAAGATAAPNPAASADDVRIKDIARVQGQRQHNIVGYGIVTGLAGTGDSSSNRATRQSIANMLSQFNLSIAPDMVSSRNVAAVMVSAAMPAFAKPGDSVDITVTSMGDARSLVGGNLLLAPLKGPDGKIYALAQGALTVGGYKYDANGNITQKNHPTAATVPGGATVEVSPPMAASVAKNTESFSIALLESDYTTASRVAEAINRELGGVAAAPIDAQSVEVTVPRQYAGRMVELIRRIESLQVSPDQRARVVINERTGTVVSGAAVRISPVAISYGDLKISVVSETAVSQPLVVGWAPSGVSSVPYTNSRIDVQEQAGATLVTNSGGTVSDLVQALAKLKTNTRDVVSILKALKSAGALHAELVVQ
ncbi:MAG: flagellar basal body P-ring protein FlgI [Aquabacterium sp.]|uniref:flagellar basal body P-ring protein FlgI n=1 Tax=Aquabacterium sp. TaxID=1872578 RepID=UPI002726F54E|nr:flagellar basal body P-ring protein FlgI [Aquabacterium sp.]MDO9005743.1 flagellar basal body P-ring protein FlgI [Aquabacterium sp.]